MHHGDESQKEIYLQKLVSGEWTGTMNLTEPHAGSDVGALTSKAEPADDGTWRIFGQKIFITWGEHDVADNIVHLVLARTPVRLPARRASASSSSRSSSSTTTARSASATTSRA